MESVLYADVLLLIDFSMDFLSLCAAGKIFSLPLSYGRMITGALTGGVGCVVITVLAPHRFLSLLAGILLSACMTWIAFPLRKEWGTFFRVVCTVWGCGILLAGILTLFAGMVPEGSGTGYGESIAASGVLLFALIHAVRRRIVGGYAEVRIKRRTDGVWCGRALVDSGNLLREPISGLPVVLLTKKAACEIMGCIVDENDRIPDGFRAVPVHDACGSRILYGHICRDIEIRRGRERMIRAAVLCTDSRADSSGYGGADVLLPSVVL